MSSVDTARNTTLSVKINNVDVTSEINKRLISATYTDSEDGEADDFEMLLADRDGVIITEWLSKEIEQRAAANKGGASKATIVPTIVQHNWSGNGRERSLNCGYFELDEVDMKGPPRTVTMRGTAMSYNTSTRTTKRTKSWEKTTLRDIGQSIAKIGGYSMLYLSDTEVQYTRAEQTAETDAVFLQKLCTKAGMSMKVTNGTIVIFDQKKYESKTTTRTIQMGDGSYGSFDFKASLSNTCYTACTVTYEDAVTGKTYEGTYPKGAATAKTSSTPSVTTYQGKEVNALYTAYYPANNKMEGGFYDAMGNKLNPANKTCAAPSSIAFGTQIQVKGTGTSRDGQVYKVTDRGGAIKVVNGVYHFDLLMSSASECNSWGRRSGKALIISGTTTSTKATTTATRSSVSTKDIVDVAISQIGYKESGNDRTKYGQYTGTNGLAWCHAFVSWCANQAGVSTNIVPKTASTDTGMDWFKQRGLFKYKGSYTPKRGDIIYFKTGASHVGIVEYVSGSTVHTIEGNSSNAVRRRSYALTYKTITGYGVPKYTSINSSSSSSSSASSASSSSDDSVLKISNERVSSNAEAEQLAMARLREANKGEITATFVMPGDVTLCAGLTVKISGFGGFDGNYYIEQAKHSISRSGYRTSISLRQSITRY